MQIGKWLTSFLLITSIVAVLVGGVLFKPYQKINIEIYSLVQELGKAEIESNFTKYKIQKFCESTKKNTEVPYKNLLGTSVSIVLIEENQTEVISVYGNSVCIATYKNQNPYERIKDSETTATLVSKKAYLITNSEFKIIKSIAASEVKKHKRKNTLPNITLF
jgi:hypothetical protein